MIRQIIFGYIIGFVIAIISIIIFIYFYTKKIDKIVEKKEKEAEMQSIINNIPQQAQIKLIKTNDLQPKVVDFNQDKVIFLNFWATWCKPCVEELPSVIDLYKKNNTLVNFFIISEEENDKIIKFLNTKNIDINLPFYSLSDSINFIKYKSIPRTYIIKNDIIYLSHLGKTNWNDPKIQKFIDGLH